MLFYKYYKMKADEEPVKGFVISCDKNRQKQALKDAYNFLAEYIEEIYTDVTQQHIHKRIKEDGKEITLETEIAYNRKASAKLLSQIETHVNCICFVKINPIFKQIDPLRVVSQIMKDVHQQGREITRFCHRILPVEKAFRAQHFRMIDELDELINLHSQSKEIKSWMLNFKCRNNNKFNYKEVLQETDKLMKKYGHFPDIYYPQWTISIEITNHLMCMSIAQNFKETNEFKLHKKLEKFKYTKEDDEELRLLNQEELEREQAERARYQAQKEEQYARKKKQKAEQPQTPKQGDSQSNAKQAQENRLLKQKIQVKEDEVDLF